STNPHPAALPEPVRLRSRPRPDLSPERRPRAVAGDLREWQRKAGERRLELAAAREHTARPALTVRLVADEEVDQQVDGRGQERPQRRPADVACLERVRDSEPPARWFRVVAVLHEPNPRA